MDDSLKKKRIIEAAVAVSVIFAILFTIIQIFGFGKNKIDTTLALVSQDSEIIGLDAYIVRNEKLIFNENAGIREYLVSDGEKVPKGTKVANVYNAYANVDMADVQKKVDSLNERISLLEKSNSLTGVSYSDVSAISKEIKELYYVIIKRVNDGELLQVKRLSDRMLILMSRYNAIINGNADLSGEIIDLKRLKEDIISANAGNPVSVFTDESGYFYRETDGFESILTVELLGKMNYSEFYSSVNSKRADTSYAVGKTVGDYKWYIAAFVSADVAGKFDVKNSEPYSVTFTQNGGRIMEMKLFRKIVSGNGDAVIVFETDKMPNDFDYYRVQNVQITITEHSGYRVPNQAIINNDGVIGVYTVDGNRVVHFKKIEIIYSGDVYSIVKENDGTDKYKDFLRQNELIITSFEKLSEGQVIG